MNGDASDGAALAARLAATRDTFHRALDSIRRTVVGQEDVLEEMCCALLAGGHVLLEGPPGTGKTLLARTFAGTLDLAFRRIQCTPDLMPGDVLGTTVLTQEAGAAPTFSFQPGPLFAQTVLVDEINRATPRTQSAFLQAMEEHAVTTGGETRALPRPFLLLATQNPVEMEGTYPLPEAQLDRFLVHCRVPSPQSSEIAEILRRSTSKDSGGTPAPVARAADVLAAQDLVRALPAAPALLEEIAAIVAASHPDAPGAPDVVRRSVRLGVSPRGARAWLFLAKARALLRGRPHVAREDLLRMAAPALRHRILRSFEAESAGLSTDAIVVELTARLR